MPDIWDHAVAPSTAPIFDDAVYLSEALGLPVNQNEDDVDAELALLARESGIHDPYRFIAPPKTISRALSTMTLNSDQRSSRSIHSQETQSTSFTSAPSRTSKDHLFCSERPTAHRTPPPPKLTRASQSVDSYANTVERAGAVIRSRKSVSSLSSVAQSAPSNVLSVQQAPPRKKRGTSILAIFRRDSSSCTSAAHHGHHTKCRGTKLECGHSLTNYDVRKHIEETPNTNGQSVPNCCGKALPRHLINEALNRRQMETLSEGTPRLSDEGPSNDSGYGEDSVASVGSSSSSQTNPLPDKAPPLPSISVRRTRHEVISIDSALAKEAFKSFKSQQKEQLERVSTFECNQRKALSAHHQSSLKQSKIQHKTNREKRKELHSDDLEQLEERQIAAEHDLREAQAQETQNVATALKYMEAYCRGTNVNHPDHSHTVTEEDFKKLDRQRLLQQDLPRKHESAINVLRARQERDTKRRVERQEEELKELDTEYEKEKVIKETEHKKDEEKLEIMIGARRTRLLQRWDLKFEMWRKDWEQQHKTTLNIKLEHEDWPPRKADCATIIPDSSSLAQYVRAAA